MIRSTLVGAVLLTLAFTPLSGFGQVDVRLGFDMFELHAKKGAIHHDTCGINSKATDGLDSSLNEIAWFPSAPYYEAHWLTQDSTEELWQRLDLRPPPTRAKPYVDHTLEVQYNNRLDTIFFALAVLPNAVDSVVIEDSTFSVTVGSVLHGVITHASVFPDTIFHHNPELSDVTKFRFRIYYNPSILDGVAEERLPRENDLLSFWPSPASRTVSWSSNSAGSLVLFDALGRDVTNLAKPIDQGQLDVSRLPAGVYTAISAAMGEIRRGRLLLR